MKQDTPFPTGAGALEGPESPPPTAVSLDPARPAGLAVRAVEASLLLHVCRWVAAAELPLLCLAAPALLFPRGVLPLVGLALILGLWFARWVATRRVTVPTSLDVPLLILLAATFLSLYPSTDLALSAPKLYGILLQVALYYSVVNWTRTHRRWWAVVAALVVACPGVALVGLVGTSWISVKLPALAALYDRIPRVIGSVPSSFGAVAGIHPNELGGTLAFLLPLPFAVALWAIGGDAATPRRRATLGASAAMLIAGPVLMLTYSRGSLVATVGACALLVGLRWRRVGLVLIPGFLLGTLALLVVGPQNIYGWALQIDQRSSLDATLPSRWEIWTRALYMIQDFPFTGIGLNTFPLVLDALYPAIQVGPDARIPHAHNIYLQTAVDLGIGGLMAFVGLWAMVGWRGVVAYRLARDPLVRGGVAGLVAGSGAYLVYGVADAITLGAKPLVLLWAMVGLIVVAGRAGELGDLAAGTVGKTDAMAPRRGTALRSLMGEVGRLLVCLYWVFAVLLTAMGYLVAGLSATGWIP